MQITRHFMQLLSKPPLRPLGCFVVKLAYKFKGINAQVTYRTDFKLWEYKIDDKVYLTQEPAWFSSAAYYLDTVRKYSGFAYIPSEGDVVLDIGAGVGEETMTFSELVGKTGRVLSIEANPKTFEVLKYRCSASNLKNVTLINAAVSAQNGQICIQDDDQYGVGNTVHTQAASKSFMVDAFSVDHILNDNNVHFVDLLKVNIEGAEREMIQGMQESVKRIKRVAISCHDFRYKKGESDYYKTFDLVRDYLKQNGFDITVQSTGNDVIDNYVYGFNTRNV